MSNACYYADATRQSFITNAVESFLASDVTKNILLPFCSLKCNIHQTIGYDQHVCNNGSHRVDPDDFKTIKETDFPAITWMNVAVDQADTVRVVYGAFNILMPLWFVKKYYFCFDDTFRKIYSFSDCVYIFTR